LQHGCMAYIFFDSAVVVHVIEVEGPVQLVLQGSAGGDAQSNNEFPIDTRSQ
jgi:hypothetical protein